MAYRTILIGTDGSVTAVAAQTAAISLAKRFRAGLVVVSAYAPPRMPKALADQIVRSAQEAAERQNVKAVTEVRGLDPAELIVDAAGRHGADLILVGNKGMGQPRRFRLGSVPDKVAHGASCDVLIVDTTGAVETPDESPVAQAPGSYAKILIGTDGSATASEAARKGFELAVLLKASVVLVYVGDPIVGAIMLEDTARSAPERVPVETHVVQGEPSEQLVEAVTSFGADLVIVGNKGMAGARRYLLASVPNAVAHRAPSSVLIAKTVDRTVEEIQPGHGALVTVGGKSLAVYRDEQGGLHALSPRCTHMGCTVDWNDAESTWDCPCHGSRFEVDGAVRRGPATTELAPAEVEG
jgi:nucleotide-binding universal stress UspA family protein/nitrite reductase/ring-hydroxylating ferredoxin subunit